MHALYVVSVFLHILASTAWLGGMLFLVLVVVPWLRASGNQNAGALLRETGNRFRAVGWTCFAILVPTGTFQLYVRGVRLHHFVEAEFLRSQVGRVVVAKLALVAIVLVVSAFHDFVVGPAATRAIEADPSSTEAQRLRSSASRYGRLNAMLALTIVALAVMIVRGVPGG